MEAVKDSLWNHGGLLIQCAVHYAVYAALLQCIKYIVWYILHCAWLLTLCCMVYTSGKFRCASKPTAPLKVERLTGDEEVLWRFVTACFNRILTKQIKWNPFALRGICCASSFTWIGSIWWAYQSRWHVNTPVRSNCSVKGAVGRHLQRPHHHRPRPSQSHHLRVTQSHQSPLCTWGSSSHRRTPIENPPITQEYPHLHRIPPCIPSLNQGKNGWCAHNTPGEPKRYLRLPPHPGWETLLYNDCSYIDQWGFVLKPNFGHNTLTRVKQLNIPFPQKLPNVLLAFFWIRQICWFTSRD